MERKTFTRTELAELLVDGLGRATKAHSAGEIQKTLAQLRVFFPRDIVKEVLDELVQAGRIAYTISNFFREGALRPGRAYHSLELLETIKARGPEDPFEGLTAGGKDNPYRYKDPVGHETPAEETKPDQDSHKSLVELAEEMKKRSSFL